MCVGLLAAMIGSVSGAGSAAAQVAVVAKTVWTMEGPAITDGVVLIGEDGKIERVGPRSEVGVPPGYAVHECAVATPGLIDVRSTVGLTGMYNVEADQDQFDRSSPVQPQLRAMDAYNPRERLVSYVRGYGVTTVHTGHAPGELMTGQTMIVKTRGGTVEEATLVAEFGVSATLSPIAQKSGGRSPGSRGKMMEMMREELFKAQAYRAKWVKWEEERGEGAEGTAGEEGGKEGSKKEPPTRDLKLETLSRVLAGEMPLIVTANKAQDIANVLRLADEFKIKVWLDMGAESYLFVKELKERGIPVLLHPTMHRATGDADGLSYGTAKTLADGGVTFAIQSGYEGYVPKVRVVLFEAGTAAGYGELGFERALRAVTIDAARILGIEGRVGSLAPGKDGDVAMYDGDPFEYTSHCVGTVIEGVVFGGERAFERNYP
jgi:imidazolonepropionase-like amidohydrolase